MLIQLFAAMPRAKISAALHLDRYKSIESDQNREKTLLSSSGIPVLQLFGLILSKALYRFFVDHAIPNAPARSRCPFVRSQDLVEMTHPTDEATTPTHTVRRRTTVTPSRGPHDPTSRPLYISTQQNELAQSL